MKRKTIAALAVLMVFTAAGCGNMGKPDATMITRKNGREDTTNGEDEWWNATDDEDITSAPEVEEPPEEVGGEEEPNEEVKKTLVEQTVDGMSTEEKVGQLFFVRVDALETDFDSSVVNDDYSVGVTFVDDMMADALKKYHVGGVALYGKNIVDPDQLQKLTKDLQSKSAIPLFIGVNEIGGDYAPIANSEGFSVKLFDNMNTVDDSKEAYTVGSTIGAYLVKYGVNTNFAPVADVSYSEELVSDCNFSYDEAVVADLVEAEIDGLHKSGVMAAVNSFPGYGDGSADGKYLYTNSSSWKDILKVDALPYLGVLGKTDMLMVGHIDLPDVISDGKPASMSKELIKGKIRDELKYEGVVMTSPMNSYSILNNYNNSKCAVDAVKAGADIVLMPYDLEDSYNAVLKAVKDGDISEDRLNESVKRILTLKEKNELLK